MMLSMDNWPFFIKKHPPPIPEITYSAVRELVAGGTEKVRKETFEYVWLIAQNIK
ncbi:MAG: hypothetical protein SGI89_10000 [bacterium]|nr:hypothetical protein [bacterium]